MCSWILAKDMASLNNANLSKLKGGNLKSKLDAYDAKVREAPKFNQATPELIESIRIQMLADEEKVKLKRRKLTLFVVVPLTLIIAWIIQWTYLHVF